MDLKGIESDVKANWWHWTVHIIGLITTVIFARQRALHYPAPTQEPPTEEEFEVSQLSNLIHNIATSVEGFLAKAPPAASSDLQSAVTQLKGAASALQTALPALAEQAANNVLDLIPGNLPYVGLEDEFIAAVITALENKKSTAQVQAAPATPPATASAPAPTVAATASGTDPLFP